MIDVVLVGVQPDFEQKIAEVTGNQHKSFPGGDIPRLIAELQSLPTPDALIFDARADQAAELAQVRQLMSDYSVSVLLIVNNAEAMGLAAMRSGVRDLIPANADAEEIHRIFHNLSQIKPARAVGWVINDTLPIQREPGRVLTLTSPKGGVGKTSTAVNLAVTLAQREPNSTVLVDLDLQFGDVAPMLHLAPQFTVAEAVSGPISRDPMAMKTQLARHESGLYVLPAPVDPSVADQIGEEHLAGLLELLASQFRYVVVDTAPGLSAQTLSALDKTTDLVLLSNLSVPAVRGLKKVTDTLAMLRMFFSRRHVVVNTSDASGGIGPADIAATVDTPVTVTLPRSKGLLAAINTGQPIVVRAKRDPFAKAIEQLAGTITTLPEPELVELSMDKKKGGTR